MELSHFDTDKSLYESQEKFANPLRELIKVFHRYQNLFQLLTELHPVRGHEHVIVLKKGFEPDSTS